MTLWWIGDARPALVVLPVVVYLLHGVLQAASGIVPTVAGIADRGRGGLARTSTPPRCCSRRRTQVEQTVAGLADYGGSLDVILDDAEERRDDAPPAPC